MQLSLPKRSIAEFVGTFWLVFGVVEARFWQQPSPTSV